MRDNFERAAVRAEIEACAKAVRRRDMMGLQQNSSLQRNCL